MTTRLSDGLVVQLRYVWHGRKVADPIPVVTTLLPSGGQRYWWSCPGCHRRAGVLYLVDGYWRCRVCGRVTYASSNASDGRIAEIIKGGFAELVSLGDGPASLDVSARTIWRFERSVLALRALEQVRRRHARELERAARFQRRGKRGRPRRRERGATS